MPENKLNDEKVLRMFVDRLIADKGGDTLDAKQKETLQNELFEELDERIQQAMIRALPDAKLMELEGLLDADAPDEKIESFFKDAGVEFDPAIRKAMDEFRTDYFKDKIKVSVKTSVLETKGAEGVPAALAAPAPVAETAPAVAAPVSVVPAPVSPAAGQPAQGTTSVTPGQSNVEGVANAVNAVAQGQAPAVQPQVVAQGANVTSNVNAMPSVSAEPSAVAATTVSPVATATPAASATSTAVVAPVASAPVTPAGEQPLQAAPNLMEALNTATANLNTTTANLGAAPATTGDLGATTGNLGAAPAASSATPVAPSAMSAVTPVTSMPTVAPVTPMSPVTPVAGNDANAGEATNTDTTGKEA